MIKKTINQNHNFDLDLLKSIDCNYIFNNEPIDRSKNKINNMDKPEEDKIKKVDIKSGDEALLEKFMQLVNDNTNNPDLNVEMIAGELGISRVHLYRKLKQLTNQSAGELITNIRLKQAATLLVSKRTNIAEVAYAVGFSSTSKFSTKFKDLYGMTPSNYRKKHLEV